MKTPLIKPDFNAFYFFHLVKVSLLPIFISCVSIGLLVVTGEPFMVLVTGGVLLFSILIVGVEAIFRYIQYRKEEYQLTSESIIARSGSLFYDRETELKLKNITDIERIYPFVESNIFGTAKIKIESAGSTTTEVFLKSVKEADLITQKLEESMVKAGFNLSTEELIYQAKPSLISVIIESITFTISAIFTIVFGIFYFVAEIDDLFTFLSNILSNTGVLLAICAITLPIYVTVIVLRLLDMSQRVYSVFDGVIRYEEGFLTKHYAVIPVQNLADAEVRQDFVRRIFGIANVILSTRGAANEVKFSNIPDAAALEASIDETIARQRHQAPSPHKLSDEHQKKGTKSSSLSTETQTTKRKQVRKFSDFATSYKINLTFILVSPLVGILFLTGLLVIIGGAIALFTGELINLIAFGGIILGIVVSTLFGLAIGYVVQIIRYIATTYEIRESSIFERFSFLNRYSREFTLDKITAIKVSRGLVQRIFNVCTIEFYSIGSNHHIAFRDISYIPEDILELRRKLDIQDIDQNTELILKPNFTLTNWILASLPSIIVSILVAAAMGAIILTSGPTATLIYIGILIFGLASFALVLTIHYWYQRTVSLRVTSDYLVFEGGIFTLIEHFAALEYVKNTTAVKFPGVDTGIVTFDVAGEVYNQTQQQQQAQWQVNQTGNQAGNISINHNKITVNYIDNVYQEVDKVDQKIADEEGMNAGAKDFDTELASAKPSLTQAGLTTAFVSLLSVVGIPFLILTLPLVLWYESTKHYSVSKFRLNFVRGIVYERRTTIVAAQIDHLEINRNFMNQIFGTGNIQINTEGSKGVEMNIANTPSYKQFYEQVKKTYNTED